MKKNEEGFVFIQLMIAMIALGAFLVFWTDLIGKSSRIMEKEILLIEKSVKYRSVFFQSLYSIIEKENHDIEYQNKEEREKIDKENGIQSICVKIENEDGKLNINQLVSTDSVIQEEYNRFFVLLFEKLGFMSFESREILSYLIKNAPVKDLDQLEYLKEMGLKREIDLTKYITVHSSGQVNINTAPREILEVILGNDSSHLTDEIIKLRKIKKINEITQMDHLKESVMKYFTVKSVFYKIKIYEKDEKNEKICSIVEKDNETIKVRQWIEK